MLCEANKCLRRKLEETTQQVQGHHMWEQHGTNLLLGYDQRQSLSASEESSFAGVLEDIRAHTHIHQLHTRICWFCRGGWEFLSISLFDDPFSSLCEHGRWQVWYNY